MEVTTALGAAPSLMPLTMKSSTSRVSCESIAGDLPSSQSTAAAGRVEQLEEVARQALVRRRPGRRCRRWRRRLVDVLPGGRRLGHLVGAVVEQRGVGVVRHAPSTCPRSCPSRAVDGMNSSLRCSITGGDVLDPALAGELGRPDDVDAHHVAIVGPGLRALDQLVALLVGGLGQLQQLGCDARAPSLNAAIGLGERAAHVLGQAERDVALGAVGSVGGEGLPPPVTPAWRRCRRCLRRRVVVAATGRERRTGTRDEPSPARNVSSLLLPPRPRAARHPRRVETGFNVTRSVTGFNSVRVSLHDREHRRAHGHPEIRDVAAARRRERGHGFARAQRHGEASRRSKRAASCRRSRTSTTARTRSRATCRSAVRAR